MEDDETVGRAVRNRDGALLSESEVRGEKNRERARRSATVDRAARSAQATGKKKLMTHA